MKKILPKMGMLLLIVFIIYSSVIFESLLTKETIEIRVVNNTYEDNTLGEKQNIIITKNEVFINKNDNYHAKSNQEYIYKNLQKNRTYKVEVVGYKLGIEIPYVLYKYRNIIRIID